MKIAVIALQSTYADFIRKMIQSDVDFKCVSSIEDVRGYEFNGIIVLEKVKQFEQVLRVTKARIK